MKRKALKQHRNFKLPKDLDQKLRKEAERTNRTQTAVLEMALRAFFVRGIGA